MNNFGSMGRFTHGLIFIIVNVTNLKKGITLISPPQRCLWWEFCKKGKKGW